MFVLHELPASVCTPGTNNSACTLANTREPVQSNYRTDILQLNGLNAFVLNDYKYVIGEELNCIIVRFIYNNFIRLPSALHRLCYLALNERDEIIKCQCIMQTMYVVDANVHRSCMQNYLMFLTLFVFSEKKSLKPFSGFILFIFHCLVLILPDENVHSKNKNWIYVVHNNAYSVQGLSARFSSQQSTIFLKI